MVRLAPSSATDPPPGATSGASDRRRVRSSCRFRRLHDGSLAVTGEVATAEAMLTCPAIT